MPNPRQPRQLVHLNAVRHDEKESRRAEAWALRLDGMTVREVASNLNISVGAAAAYLQESLAELKATSRESADSWRQLHLDRLDAVISTWLPVSRDPSHPEAARGAAIVVRSVEAQARLQGLLLTSTMPPLGGNGQPATPIKTVEELAAYVVETPELASAFRRALEKAERAKTVTPAVPAGQN